MPITLGDKKLGSVASPVTGLHLESSTTENDRSLRLAYDGTFYSEMRNAGAAGIVFRNNSTTDLVTINGSGHVITPFMPHARITYSESSVLTVRENNGSHWNTGTGRFTCPVAGRYLACVHLSSASANNGISTPRTWVALLLNGGAISGIGNEVLDKWGVPVTGGSGAYDMGTAMVVTTAAGDYFQPTFSNGGDIIQYTFTLLG
jgi:hypothetical protein